MQQVAILLPMLGMIFLTFGIMIWMLKLRYKAIREDGLNPAYFTLNRGGKLPDYLSRVTQHYENLLEMPLLFYMAILFVLTLNFTSISYVVLSWLFLVLRLIHSVIHTTYNKVLHRRNAFVASTLVLFVLWLKIVIDTFGLL